MAKILTRDEFENCLEYVDSNKEAYPPYMNSRQVREYDEAVELIGDHDAAMRERDAQKDREIKVLKRALELACMCELDERDIDMEKFYIQQPEQELKGDDDA